MSLIDPLDGLERRPVGEQVAVLATEVRNQRNAITQLAQGTAAVQKALWYLVASIIVGIVVFVATTTIHASHSVPTTPAAKTP